MIENENKKYKSPENKNNKAVDYLDTEKNLNIHDENLTSYTCSVCEDYNDILTLPCSCLCTICQDCLFDWIAEINFNTVFSNIILTPCANHNCKNQIPFDWIFDNLNNKNKKCLSEILSRKFTNTSSDVIKCPNQFCDYRGWVDFSKKCALPLKCEICRTEWIDQSLVNFHIFYLLYLFFVNFKENFFLSLTEINILLSTKPCPHCGIKINKFVGCDHVSCTSCRKNFCYNCISDHEISANFSRVSCSYKYIIFGISLFFFLYFGIMKIFFTFKIMMDVLMFILYLFLVDIIAIILIGIFSIFAYMIIIDFVSRRQQPEFSLLIRIICSFFNIILISGFVYSCSQYNYILTGLLYFICELGSGVLFYFATYMLIFILK